MPWMSLEGAGGKHRLQEGWTGSGATSSLSQRGGPIGRWSYAQTERRRNVTSSRLFFRAKYARPDATTTISVDGCTDSCALGLTGYHPSGFLLDCVPETFFARWRPVSHLIFLSHLILPGEEAELRNPPSVAISIHLSFHLASNSTKIELPGLVAHSLPAKPPRPRPEHPSRSGGLKDAKTLAWAGADGLIREWYQ